MNIIVGLIFAGISISVYFIWMFIKGFMKSRNDPDVILASKLGMTMPIYKDCQKVFAEYKEWLNNEEEQKKYNETGETSFKLNPKNPNAFRRYESYMWYLNDVEKWEKLDEGTKNYLSFDNPYKKEEYKWIRNLGL